MRKEIAFLMFILLAGFSATALAAGAATPTDQSTLGELVRAVAEAFRGGQYAFAGSLALVLAVAATRKYGSKRVPWLASDMGGAMLTLVGAFGASMAATLSGGASPSWHMAWTATGIAVSAAGGYALIKKLAVDPLLASAWYKEKAPAWLRACLDIALWVFTKPSDGAKAIEKAEAEGAKAVEAKPAPGPDGVVGKAEDL